MLNTLADSQALNNIVFFIFTLEISKPYLMEEGAKFKFEPIWVSALGLMSLFIFYKIFSAFVADPSYDLFGLIFLSCPLIFLAMILPMFFKMIIGIPAIELNHDQLINNVVGIKVNWENVENIRITGTYKPFLSIDLKDTHAFYSSIKNPLKRLLIKGFFLLGKGDVPINLAFVAGNEESVAAVARVYWNRYYGIND